MPDCNLSVFSLQHELNYLAHSAQLHLALLQRIYAAVQGKDFA